MKTRPQRLLSEARRCAVIALANALTAVACASLGVVASLHGMSGVMSVFWASTLIAIVAACVYASRSSKHYEQWSQSLS